MHSRCRDVHTDFIARRGGYRVDALPPRLLRLCRQGARLALAEKQLAWDGKYIDILKGEQFDQEFLKLNPKAMVPVLTHDGNVIAESTLICEYLEEVFPDTP